ncbi:UNVERIFIED_CONTAM: D-glycerate 3-kinase, chloroplastic [Sesamum latifolium]|uniref:D-glycerate 3-kinase, chloroplastic n=1 Tax=Sesamum latifolium TaxID=2727402 RepID=A0AAW2UEC0_9LAMI
MAVLTVFSPPTNPSLLTPSPSSLSISYYFNTNDCTHWYCLHKNNSKWAPFSTIPLVSKQRTRARAKSKLCLMQSQMMPESSSSSGSGCSWMKDNSSLQDKLAGHGMREGPLRSVFPTKPAEVASVKDLFEFICAGPLIDKVGLTSDKVAESIDKWEISRHSSKFKDEDDIPPLVIGFSAPQGCGKTTLVFALDFLFRINGRNTATISIDDFYLTAEGQAKLRESNPGNALLEFRGNAGSHDLSLSIETLTALSKLTREGTKMKLPRYDKSAYSGRGDRADPSTWPEVEGPLTAVLFEGWMLGFKPVPVEVVKAVDPQLEIVNKNLEAYFDAWDKFIKSWIVIKIQDPSCVYQWRLQVLDFVSRYLPAYKAYLPTLYGEGPNGSDPEHLLVVEIDEGRNPILAN